MEEIILNDSTSHIRTNQQSQITLSDEYIRKLKLDKDDLVIKKIIMALSKLLLQM